ncbi:hypothetical protein BEE12_16210 [Pantoea agglomerans]|uniref:hypothetical protein n=1 Tax=Enterobacter agglomerans TaxID=549 RepID=UPI00083D5247|nr:hypothetical protein [Pantoea agglomerans]AOE41260.1 hypothetical protein BEE12_16210 [Pantoea agglomerans]
MSQLKKLFRVSRTPCVGYIPKDGVNGLIDVMYLVKETDKCLFVVWSDGLTEKQIQMNKTRYMKDKYMWFDSEKEAALFIHESVANELQRAQERVRLLQAIVVEANDRAWQ